MEASDSILIEEKSDYIVCSLNRPKALNAINKEIMVKLVELLNIWNSKPNLSFVLLKGEGGKAFCAGGDVKWFYELLIDKKIEELLDFFQCEYNFDYQLSLKKFKMISLLDGYVMGGGVGLSLHSDIKIATEKSVFAMPENRIGIIPDVGSSYILGNIGPYGLYLGITGSRLKGKELVKAGVATHYMNSSKISEFQNEIFKNAENLKKMEDFYTILSKYCEDCNDTELKYQNEINELFQKNENFSSLLTNIKSVSNPFFTQIYNEISILNPICVRLSYESLKFAHGRPFRDCLEMESNIIFQLLEYDNEILQEGIRALIIDKDNNPKWKIKNLEDIPEELICQFLNEELSKKKIKLD